MACVQVFGLPACTDVARVLACLFEKDVEFQLVRTDTYKGEHKVPEFLKLQDPAGPVTYKEGKKTLTDSREICRYVAGKFPDQGNKYILGTGALERASIEQWLQSEEQNFEPPSSALVFHLAFAPHMNNNNINNNGGYSRHYLQKGEDPAAVIERHRERLSKLLDIYESRLGVTEYLAGDEFTLADLSHLPNSHYLVNKTKEGRELFRSRRNVSRWWDAISSRQSWKKVVQMQSEHPGPLEK